MSIKKLSVIFPIYNEQNTIKRTLIEWKNSLDKLSINYEMIIAEDGSTDDTKQVLNSLLIKNKRRFVSNIKIKKRGYADAVISSVKIAKGKYILSVDSDGQCDPKDFTKFWKKRYLLTNSVMIGHRFKRNDTKQRLLMSKFFLLFHRILFFSNIKDPSCPFVIGRNKTFKKLPREKLLMMREGFWWGFVGAAKMYKLKFHQISKDVNNPMNNDPGLIKGI